MSCRQSTVNTAVTIQCPRASGHHVWHAFSRKTELKKSLLQSSISNLKSEIKRSVESEIKRSVESEIKRSVASEIKRSVEAVPLST